MWRQNCLFSARLLSLQHSLTWLTLAVWQPKIPSGLNVGGIIKSNQSKGESSFQSFNSKAQILDKRVMATEPFCYPTLDRNTASIRLLSFDVQAEDSDRITCSLKTWEIDKCPPFIALSYVWGDAALWIPGPELPPHGIIVDGKRFQIRENLWEAMHVLRAHTRAAPIGSVSVVPPYDPYANKARIRNLPTINCFWIDAICINQADLQERGHQVSLMKQIYSIARTTIAWIGPEHPNSHLALKTLAGCPRGPVEKAALATLRETAYYGRMWVIQECLISRDLFFLWGTEGIWWNSDFHKTVKDIVNDGIALPGLALINSWKGAFNLGERRDLVTLILSFSYSACSDPRDKVYGLLGLVVGQPPFAPDYTISKVQLYYRVLGHLRHSEDFYNTDSWEFFRFNLRDTLKMYEVQHERLAGLFYSVTEGGRLNQRQAMGLKVAQSDLWGTINYVPREQTAKEMLQKFYRKHQQKGKEHPDGVQGYILSKFPSYVRQEDSEGWKIFEQQVLQEAKMVHNLQEQVWGTQQFSLLISRSEQISPS